MSGNWIKIVQPEHRCMKPQASDLREPIGAGSIWRCGCGVHWELLHSGRTLSWTRIACDSPKGKELAKLAPIPPKTQTPVFPA